MAKKPDLKQLIAKHVEPPEGLKRGRGLTLSTDPTDQKDEAVREKPMEVASSQATKDVASPIPPIPSTTPLSRQTAKRVNRGFTIREDVVKLLRLVAFEEDRHLYEVVEEACIALLKKKHKL